MPRRVRLGDVVENVNEFFSKHDTRVLRYVAGEHIDEDDLRVSRYGMTSDDLVPPTFNRVFEAGDVLFHSRNIRKLAQPDFSGLTGEKLFVLRSKDQRQLLQGLLPFLLKDDRFTRYIEARWTGSTNKFLNKTPLMAYEFVLPSLFEQQRMLAALCAAEEVRSAAVDAHKAANSVLSSALVNLYSNGIRGDRTVLTEIGYVPASWDVRPLGAVYDVQLGKKLYEKFTIGDGQIPYLRNANVLWNQLDLTDVATMTFTDREWSIYELKPGDILACEGRHVGRASLWRGELPSAAYQMALHRLRTKDPQQEPRFMLHCLRYYSISGKFRGATGETTIPHLPAEKFKKLLFPFPPQSEQIEIADAIDAIYSAIASSALRVAQAEKLLSSIRVFE